MPPATGNSERDAARHVAVNALAAALCFLDIALSQAWLARFGLATVDDLERAREDIRRALVRVRRAVGAR